MKLYYLAEPSDLSYALVWAHSPEEAKEKATKQREFCGLAFSEWETCEEFTADTYNGILLFG